eukprot:m.114335 g.114335  ORF g.114335 m.114335 type:complete len:80 (+) comp37485_c0_seq13:1515-1754(+)
MERIHSLPSDNYFVRPSKSFDPEPVKVCSEIGFYGVLVRSGGRVLINETAGHLVRVKVASSNEGGIFAGFGAFGSPWLK